MKNSKNVIYETERFPQGLSDDLCGVKCIESIYAFHKDTKSSAYFIRELALADEFAYLPQLLRLLSRDGYDVVANISQPQIFDLGWSNLIEDELISKVEQRYLHIKQSRWKRLALEYLLYLKDGNKITQKIINEKLISEYIQKGYFILAPVDNVIFHQRERRYWDEKNKTYDPDDIRGGSDGHVVLVNGWNSQKGVHIIDPSTIQTYSKTGNYWIDCSVLIAGIYSLSGEIGLVKIKK